MSFDKNKIRERGKKVPIFSSSMGLLLDFLSTKNFVFETELKKAIKH